jgi:hypothetical protein
MRKGLFIFIILIVSAFVMSCGEDEDYGEKLDGPPDDWDYSNVVGDDESAMPDDDSNENNIPDNSNPVEDDNKPDENESNDDNNGGNEQIKGCGNEDVEYSERCDSPIPVECQNLNPNMEGIAYCANDCLSYDLSECSLKKKIWGVLNVRFNTNFILDSAKISDHAYFKKGTQPYAAFGAIYGEDEIQVPSKNERSIVSFAFTSDYAATFGNKRQLFVKQYPVVGGAPDYPRLELEFAPGGLTKDSEYRINAISTIDLIDHGLFKLVRFRLVENQGNGECIMGVGYSGTVYITDVFPQNADLYDGGSVEIVSNNVVFYHPDDVEEMGGEPVHPDVLNLPVCIK